MPLTLAQAYPDLRFTKTQLYFSDDEYLSVAKEFWGNVPTGGLSNRDRAFIQAGLFVAIDKSEKASFVFSLYKSFMSAAPSRSIMTLAKKLATSGAKQAFSNYIDDTPKYSPAGRAGVQYSAFATQWKVRVGLGDDTFLDNFFIE